jgi:hypothetical protein
MTAKNDITGDSIKSRINTRSFEDNFDQIFNKSDKNCHIEDTKDNEMPANKQPKILASGDGPDARISGENNDAGDTALGNDL